MLLEDLRALELQQALELCEAARWEVEVVTTLPPRDNTGCRLRVIRAEAIEDGKLLLTVTPEQDRKEV